MGPSHECLAKKSFLAEPMQEMWLQEFAATFSYTASKLYHCVYYPGQNFKEAPAGSSCPDHHHSTFEVRSAFLPYDVPMDEFDCYNEVLCCSHEIIEAGPISGNTGQ